MITFIFICITNSCYYPSARVAGDTGYLREPCPALRRPACLSALLPGYCGLRTRPEQLREMGGAARNPAPRNHFLVWTVKSSGGHCTDAFGEKHIVECRPLLGALPLSLATHGAIDRATHGAIDRATHGAIDRTTHGAYYYYYY